MEGLESIERPKKGEGLRLLKRGDVNPTPIFIYVDMGSGGRSL